MDGIKIEVISTKVGSDLLSTKPRVRIPKAKLSPARGISAEGRQALFSNNEVVEVQSAGWGTGHYGPNVQWDST